LSYLKADLSDAQLKVLNKFWPGKFTFILNTNLNYKYCVLEAKIAVRLVSNLPVADMIDYFDKPVTATSANFSGQEYDPSIKNIIKNFSNKVNYYIYQGTDNKNPSSIIDLTIPGYRIIRNSHNIKLEDL
jgi:L-threonylcarbamoyladenylate synthase